MFLVAGFLFVGSTLLQATRLTMGENGYEDGFDQIWDRQSQVAVIQAAVVIVAAEGKEGFDVLETLNRTIAKAEQKRKRPREDYNTK